MVLPTYSLVLFAAAAAAYVVLTTLLLLSKRKSATHMAMVAACAITFAAMGAAAADCCAVLSPSGALVELASPVAWCAFLLYLLRRHIRPDLNINRLMVGCGISITAASLAFAFAEPGANGSVTTPLTLELFSRLALGTYGVFLIENLYRN